MGREIRMVPPNWEHPKKEDGSYRPMFKEDFDSELQEWLTNYELWKAGNHPSQKDYPFWEWEGPPPDPNYYRPVFTEDPTWCQIYETVSEGTPVTPPFSTKKELVNYLVENGDFWDQIRGDGGWNRENAEQFVGCGWAPSMITTQTADKCEIKMARDGA